MDERKSNAPNQTLIEWGVAASELVRHPVFQGGGTLTLIAQIAGKKALEF